MSSPLAKQSCFPRTAHSSSSRWAAGAVEATAVLGLCSLSYMYPAWQIRLLRGLKLKKRKNIKISRKLFAHGGSLRQGRWQQRDICASEPPWQSHLKNCRRHEMPSLSVSFRATFQRILFSVLFTVLIPISC